MPEYQDIAKKFGLEKGCCNPYMNSIAQLAECGEIVVSSPSLLELRQLQDVQGPDPRLAAGVDEDYQAWRAAVHARSGYDFLARSSDALRPAYFYRHRLGYLSWHKTGRAVDLLFDWQDEQGKNALYVVREDLAGEVYWRMFIKCAVQDGSLVFLVAHRPARTARGSARRRAASTHPQRLFRGRDCPG